METLRFGRPESFEQAILRLPNTDHPEYKIIDGPIQNLNYLKETLESTLKRYEQERTFALEDRLVSLNLEDIKLMETISFKRQAEGSNIVQWEYMRPENMWSQIYPCTDDDYRWWRVTRMVPEFDSEGGLILIGIETNATFSTRDIFRHDGAKSEYDIGFVIPSEFDALVGEITRWKI